MAEQPVVAELLVERHLRKYLVMCLTPETQHHTKYGADLARAIAEVIAFSVRLAPVQVQVQQARVHLTLDLGNLPDLDPHTHRKVVDTVQQFYHAEFVRTVDQLHHDMRMSRSAAIDMFRRLYGITEDDYPLRSSERAYHRHLRRKGLTLRPGRPAAGTVIPIR